MKPTMLQVKFYSDSKKEKGPEIQEEQEAKVKTIVSKVRFKRGKYRVPARDW